MLPIYQETFKTVTETHADVYNMLASIRQAWTDGLLPLEEKIDLCYACREIVKMSEDLRKEVNKLADAIQYRVAVDLIKNGKVEPIKTEYCTAEPVSKPYFVFAKGDTQNAEERNRYEKNMRWLGVDENLWDNGKMLTHEGEIETEVVKINWEGLQGYCQRLFAAGQPLPDGIDLGTSYHKFTLHIVKKKSILPEG